MMVTRWVSRFVMMGIVLVFGSVVLGASPQAVSQPNEQLVQAEKAYQEGQYDKAITLYSSILTVYPRDPNVLFNLGNASLKAERISDAILAYRRALVLAPKDRDILENLDMARSKVIDKVTDKGSLSDAVYSMVSIVTLNGWTWIGLILLTGMAVALAGMVTRRYRAMGRSVLLTCLGLSVVWAGCFWFKFKHDVLMEYGVITAQKVPVRTGPADTLDTSFFVHEGVEFRLVNSSGYWIEILLKNGLTGWIKSTEAERVTP